MKETAKKNRSAWKQRVRGTGSRIVCALLCALLLGTNVMSAFAVTTTETDPVVQSTVETGATEPETATGATEPETATEATEPETATEATEPETATEATEPETATGATEPETATEATEPETATGATEPETATGATEPETATEATEPETATEATEPETATEATEPETATEATEPETTKLCKHHPAHDDSCGGTEETCGFVCALCPVQKQVDDVNALLETVNAEELDEEGFLRLFEKALEAKRAFERLTWSAQGRIEGIETVLSVLETMGIQTLVDDGSAVNGMEVSTALIRAEGAPEQSLTNGGSFTVDFSRQFTLHIVIKSQLNLANKRVEITVPAGLTVVEFPIPVRGGMVESVTPESVEDLNSGVSYGDYRPKTGTITYSLRSTSEETSFNIILAPDTVLWNRSSAQVLKDPLKIRVYTDAQTYQTISATPTITGKYNDAVGDNRAIQTGPRLSRVGVKTGVPAAANQPFALRQIWINPDKDYIDMPQFFQKLEITIALPYYTKNGSNIYAEFDHVTYDPAGQSDRPNLLDPGNHQDADGSYKDGFNFTETVDEANHTVKLTWTNLYLKYGQDYFTPYFAWTAGNTPANGNTVTWYSDSIFYTGNTSPGCYEGGTPAKKGGSVGGKITWQDGREWYPWNNAFEKLSFTAYDNERMTVDGRSTTNIYNASDPSITYYLGQFHVVNHGGGASAEKMVEFTYLNNGKIGVTAQKIPATTGNEVNIWYTTNKSETIPRSYGGTPISEGGFVTFTAQMAGLKEGEYFTSIIASVGSYAKDYVGYVASRSSDPTSGFATTFGRLLSSEGGSYSNFASMKMYDESSKNNEITGSFNVNVTTTKGQIPLAMEQAYRENTVLERVPILSDPDTGESKTAATAGETIRFNGLISSSAYPYSSNNIAVDPVIYIRLPEKITVSNLSLYREAGRMADKVFLFDAVTETVAPTREAIAESAYQFEEVPAAATAADDTTGDSYKLYQITFLNSEKLGWFTDGLGQYQIGLSFDMEIAKDSEAMTLDMRDCVRMRSKTLNAITDTGTLSQYLAADTYDMDGNGNTVEKFVTFNVNAAGTKLSVVAARLGLTFSFGARKVDLNNTDPDYNPGDYKNFEKDREKVYLKDQGDAVDLLFTLKNETGRAFSEAEAKAFYYFIPVPKSGDYWDSHMQDKPFDFNMVLKSAPTVSGVSKDNVLVKYSTTVDAAAAPGDPLHYSNPDKYVEESAITDWNQVKMVRIAVKETATGIRKNAELEVCLHYVPEFESNADLVGSVVNFGPCGVSPYSVGNTPNQGHNPLPRIQVEFETGLIKGKIFNDKDFNGQYDKGADALYPDDVQVTVKYVNEDGGDGQQRTETARNGEFTFTGCPAGTYYVTIANPGSEDQNSDNSWKFSLPETGGDFHKDGGAVTATFKLEKNNGTAELTLGLQQPHTVTFSVPNGQGGTTTNVWHGDKLETVPAVTSASGWKFTGNWTAGSNTYTADRLRELPITGDTTFTAEVKRLYSVSYNLNGGTGAAAPATTWHIKGEQVLPDYTNTEKLKKGEKTIFVGWSEDTPIKNVLTADAEKADIDKIIDADKHTMPDHNVSLYAVYAMDANGNNNPDYNDDAVHVRYHGNNGDYTDVICPHHHVAGATAKLSTSGQVSGRKVAHDKSAADAAEEITSCTFTHGSNIFVGWSTTPILNEVIKTNKRFQELRTSIVTEVIMENADTDGNTNVYAVWAADRNGNKIADYLEEYQLTYDGNAQLGGTVDNVPRDTGIYIPGDTCSLSGEKPTHTEADNKAVVFMGWTETRTNAIFSRGDTAPETVDKVIFGSGHKTVYAAWGYDENADGVVDALETYTLAYDLNGGSGNLPEAQKNLKKGTAVPLTEEKSFTRNDQEVFIGWSYVKYPDAFTAEQGDEAQNCLIKDAAITIGAENVTVYAVWAVDGNKNKIPDYQEALSLTYDGNAQSGGMVNDVPSDPTVYRPGDTQALSTEKPKHADVKGIKVVFIGWTAQKTDKLYGGEDTAPACVTSLTFADKSVTVYAAWGYDENGSGVADALETFTLAYDLNGGSGNLPEAQKNLKKGTVVPLTEEKSFTRNEKELFVGWSFGKHPDAFTAEQGDEAERLLITDAEVTMGTEDVTLYAVWAEDRDGDGKPDYSARYTVTYELDGGSGDTGYDRETVKPGALHQVKAAPSRTGFEFLSWKDGSGRTYQPGDRITVTGDMTLTAQWKEKPAQTDPTGPAETSDPTGPAETSDPTGPAETSDPTGPAETSDPTGPAETSDPTGPAETSDPTGPAETSDPTGPAETSDPTGPAETSDPTGPAETSDPTGPAETSDSTEPSKPSESSKPTKPTDGSPSTGDSSNAGLWLAVMCVSGAGIMALLVWFRRKEKE